MNANYSQPPTERRRKTRPSSQLPPCENIPPPPLHTLSLSELLRRPAPEYSWLVEPLLTRGGVMGLAGEPGTAKTWLILELAQAVATGRSFLQRFATRQGPVLIIDEENGEARLQRRLARLTGGKLEDCPVHIASMCGVNLSRDQWIDSLHGKLTEIRPQLTILDSLVRMHSGEENSAQDIARLFAVLTSFRSEFGSAIVFTHHLRKMSLLRDMSQRVRGSSDILAYVDSMLGLSRVEPAFALSHIKNRDGDLINPLSLSVEDTDDGTTVIRIIGEFEEETSKREQARKLIVTALQAGETFRDELADLATGAGISPRTFATALKDLESVGLVAGTFDGKRKKYSPSAHLQPLHGLQALPESRPPVDPSFANLQSPYNVLQPLQMSQPPVDPSFANLQSPYNILQGLQESPAEDQPPPDPNPDPTFALLQPTPDTLQKSPESPPTSGAQADHTEQDPTFALLQQIQGTDQAPQTTPVSEPELTPDEKRALAEHWRTRNNPPVTVGGGHFFNLRALLYSDDPYLIQKCLEHAADLRRLLAGWDNPDDTDDRTRRCQNDKNGGEQ